MTLMRYAILLLAGLVACGGSPFTVADPAVGAPLQDQAALPVEATPPPAPEAGEDAPGAVPEASSPDVDSGRNPGFVAEATAPEASPEAEADPPPEAAPPPEASGSSSGGSSSSSGSGSSSGGVCEPYACTGFCAGVRCCKGDNTCGCAMSAGSPCQ
jgi:hypothetical protein